MAPDVMSMAIAMITGVAMIGSTTKLMSPGPLSQDNHFEDAVINHHENGFHSP